LSLASAALVLPRQLALFTTAVAVLALLTQHILSEYESTNLITSYTSAGLLGLMMFITSIGAQRFGERYRETEALAKRRGVDIANLSQLNDYVVQRMRESIVVIDGTGHTRLMNQSAARLLGVDDPKNKYHLAELSTKLHLQWQESIEQPYKRSERVVTLDGLINLIPSFVPLGNNPAEGTILFIEDLSLIQEKVQQSKLAALGRLSASIAHEIRNPLAAINHSSQLLSESSNLTDDDLYFTSMIDKQVKRMNQIIENVMGLTRAPLDKPDLLDLHVLLEKFTQEFIQSAELDEQQIQLHFDQTDDESKRHFIPFGETQLSQVLSNLFENALRHAQSDKTPLQIKCYTGIHEVSGRLKLEIIDNGQGLGEHNLDEIFEPFHSGSAAGSGLGLYIARELCSLNYASLNAENHPNGGACFRILFADKERWVKPD